MSMGLEDMLNDHLLQHVLEFVPMENINRVAGFVNSRWNGVCHAAQLWQSRFSQPVPEIMRRCSI